MPPKGKKWVGRPNDPNGNIVSLFIYLNQAPHCQSGNTIFFCKKRHPLVVKTAERIRKNERREIQM